MVLLIPRTPASVESEWYLYDATGHGWICLRPEEQMDVDQRAGVYPDGTRVAVLEKREGGLYNQPRYKVQIGRAVGWVFEDELLTEEVWLQKKESGQYVPFESHWYVNRNGESSVNLYPNGYLFGSEPIGTVNEPSFIALGIHAFFIHVQLGDMDGYMSDIHCIPDKARPDDTLGNREIQIWIGTLERAVKKAKGTDEANWTEAERLMLTPRDPNNALKSDREIEPSTCDISSLEAEWIIWQALIDGGYVTDDNLALVDRKFYYLYYDYQDPGKHIWLFVFSDSSHKAELELVTNFIVELDSHTGEIISIIVDGPC